MNTGDAIVMMSAPVLGIAAAVFLTCLALSFGVFDWLVRHIHHSYPDLWAELGQPCGFSWEPRFERMRSRNRVFNALRSKLPDWTQSDKWMLQRSRLFRTLVRIGFFAGALGAVACIALIMGLLVRE